MSSRWLRRPVILGLFGAQLNGIAQCWALLLAVGMTVILLGAPVSAQVFFPWEERPNFEPRRQAPQREAPPREQPRRDSETDRRATQEQQRVEYCQRLEQQLVDEWRRSSSSRDELPKIEQQIREADANFRKLSQDAERRQCYEDAFLFGRTLRRTPECVRLNRDIETARRDVRTLQQQRERIARPGASRSTQDDLIAELARRGCGADYQRQYEARRRAPSFFSFFGEREDTFRQQPDLTEPALPFSTYRTMCVRACDGYYFPVSFSTLPSQFAADETKCQNRCAAPSSLFIYRNPGEEIEQMVSLDGKSYSSLPNAWLYRKRFISGCSCNSGEYSQDEIARSMREGETGTARQSPTAADAETETAAQQPVAPIIRDSTGADVSDSQAAASEQPDETSPPGDDAQVTARDESSQPSGLIIRDAPKRELFDPRRRP
jgi:hypothetical protein